MKIKMIKYDAENLIIKKKIVQSIGKKINKRFLDTNIWEFLNYL